MKYIFIYDKGGNVISKSRNLRGIHDYCRSILHRPATVQVFECSGSGASVSIRWPSGAHCLTDFASFGVASKWAQHRRFAPADVTITPLAPAAQEKP